MSCDANTAFLESSHEKILDDLQKTRTLIHTVRDLQDSTDYKHAEHLLELLIQIVEGSLQ